MNFQLFTPHDSSSVTGFFDGYLHDSSDMDSIEFADLVFICNNNIFAKGVRKSIELFKNHFRNIKVIDLGILSPLGTQQIKDIIDYFDSLQTKVVLVGFDNAITEHFSARKLHIVSNRAYKNTDPSFQSDFIGYQRHLVDYNLVQQFEEGSESISLGKMRSGMNVLEPILRDAKVVLVDLNVLRRCDAPNISDSLPTGLNAEELCQVSKFVGLSNRIKYYIINGNLAHDTKGEEEFAIGAEAVWYFLEGINMKINDHPEVHHDRSSYVIHSSELDIDITFVKNNITQKWWVKNDGEGVISEYLACSKEEYESTIDENIPLRIQKFLDI